MLWPQSGWCLLWRKLPHPLVETGSKGQLKKGSYQACGTPEAADRYREAKWCAAVVVTEAKTWVLEEFGEAMENNFCMASERFWITIWHMRKGKQCNVVDRYR